MKMRVLLGAAGLGGAAILVGQMDVGAETGNVQVDQVLVDSDDALELGTQPDVYVWLISGLANWGPTSGYRAYSVGTTSCNQGNAVLTWNGGNNQHPVISQGMFRLAPGANGHDRFEMIGQSWLKHGFCALDFNDCGNCQGTGCGSLGLGCSDPYTAGRNGSQGPAGPKYQVNATSGFFPYPPANGTGISDNTSRRLRVATTDTAGGTTADQRFFIEAQYIHPQDSAADSEAANNNASYREVNLTSTGFASSYIGNTQQFVPAVYAWPAADPLVTTRLVKVPGEGLGILMYRVYDNGDGTWDYEYLLYNQNFDRNFNSFTVPVPDDVTLTNIDFHDVDYHSGDGLGNQNFEGTTWTSTHTGGELTWSTDDFLTNSTANAIRWGTGYNFRFTANTAPQPNIFADIGAYRAGTANLWSQKVDAPTACAGACGTPCLEDLDGSGDVGFSDVLQIISVWGCVACPAEDLSGNGTVDFADILAAIAAWGPCP